VKQKRFNAEQIVAVWKQAESPGVLLEEVQEVSNYVAAMNHGLRRLRGGFPLSLRLIRDIHKILLSKGRGRKKAPVGFGRLRTGLGAPAQVMRHLFRRRPRGSWSAWVRSRSSCIACPRTYRF
jgi:Fic family protein